MRTQGAMTTKLVREQPFTFIIATGNDKVASGSLYIDDGVSLFPPKHRITSVLMTYSNNKLRVQGQFGYRPPPDISSIAFLNVQMAPQRVEVDGLVINPDDVSYNSTSQYILAVLSGVKLDHAFEVELFY
jgi:alpha-glucosidase